MIYCRSFMAAVELIEQPSYVYMLLQKTPKFLCILTVAWSSSGGVQYVLPVCGWYHIFTQWALWRVVYSYMARG